MYSSIQFGPKLKLTLTKSLILSFTLESSSSSTPFIVFFQACDFLAFKMKMLTQRLYLCLHYLVFGLWFIISSNISHSHVIPTSSEVELNALFLEHLSELLSFVFRQLNHLLNFCLMKLVYFSTADKQALCRASGFNLE